MAEEAVALVGADHDQAALVVFGDLDQALPGGGRLDRQGRGGEARLVGQVGALFGGFLGGRLDLVGSCRLKLAAFGRDEADVGGTAICEVAVKAQFMCSARATTNR